MNHEIKRTEQTGYEIESANNFDENLYSPKITKRYIAGFSIAGFIFALLGYLISEGILRIPVINYATASGLYPAMVVAFAVCSALTAFVLSIFGIEKLLLNDENED